MLEGLVSRKNIIAVGYAHVFHGFLTLVLTQLFFPKPRLLFSHASGEVSGENTPERKFASTEDRTHNHQVMSPTCSALSHPGGGPVFAEESIYTRGYRLSAIQQYNTLTLILPI